MRMLGRRQHRGGDRLSGGKPIVRNALREAACPAKGTPREPSGTGRG